MCMLLIPSLVRNVYFFPTVKCLGFMYWHHQDVYTFVFGIFFFSSLYSLKSEIAQKPVLVHYSESTFRMDSHLLRIYCFIVPEQKSNTKMNLVKNKLSLTSNSFSYVINCVNCRNEKQYFICPLDSLKYCTDTQIQIQLNVCRNNSN